jgi:nucleoside-diphosphate-sugar epimerase
MESALVTGASGFIGSRLLARLIDDGVEARGLDFSTDLRRQVYAGDIAEPGEWQDAAGKAEVVIHAAAVLDARRATPEVAWRTNVLGTRHVLDAAIAGGVRRFVHISTAAVFGDADFPDEVPETYPAHPDGDPFTQSKLASEQVVLQAHAAGEIECTILRPADVYGPGSRRWTVRPFEAIRSNRFVLPARGEGIFSPLYVDNLVDAIGLACDREEAAGEVFTISDGIGITCREFFGRYSRMLGKQPPPALPSLAAAGLAAVPEAAARIGGLHTDYRRDSLRPLARPGTYSIAKARRLLGYEPRVGLDEGMQLTEMWLREHGLLRRSA